MITCDTNLIAVGSIEAVPRSDGLYVVLREEGTDLPWVWVKIPLTDLLRYASLVQLVERCPPGWEDLASAAETIR